MGFLIFTFVLEIQPYLFRNEAILARGYSIQCLRSFTNVCGAGLFFCLEKKKVSLRAAYRARGTAQFITWPFLLPDRSLCFSRVLCRETRIMSVLAKVCFNCQTTNNYKRKKNRVLIQGIVDFPCTNLP